MKYKLSKLVIGLAAVCAFSGQAFAGGGTIPVISDPDLDGTFIGSFSDSIPKLSVAHSFSDVFTFTLTSAEAGSIVLNAKTNSSSLSGLKFTLEDMTTSKVWNSSNQVLGTTKSSGLNVNSLAAGLYDLTVMGNDVKNKTGTVTGNFTITPVPEPTEGALLLSGLGLFGFIAARRGRSEA